MCLLRSVIKQVENILKIYEIFPARSVMYSSMFAYHRKSTEMTVYIKGVAW